MHGHAGFRRCYRRRSRRVSLLVAVLALACERSRHASPDARVNHGQPVIAESVDDDSSTDEPLARPRPHVAAGPGPAYFLIDRVGVARLDHGEIELIWALPERDPLRDRWDGARSVELIAPVVNTPWRMLHGLDGQIYATAVNLVFRFEADGNVTQVAQIDPVEAPYVALLVDANGELWAASPDGEFILHVVDGRIEQIQAPPGAGPRAAVPDGRGGLWMAGRELVYHHSPVGEWSTLGAAVPGIGGYDELWVTPPGRVFVSAGERRFELERDGLHEIDFAPHGPPVAAPGAESSLLYGTHSARGVIAVANDDCSVRRFDPEQPERVWGEELDDEGCERLDALAIDDAARLWLASRAGLLVIDADGQRHNYPSGSLDRLPGDVRAIIVAAAGPTLPARGPSRTTDWVLALDDHQHLRLRNTEVEMCPAPGYVSGPTPCAGSVARFAGRTDAHGLLEFADVPHGYYEFVAKTAGGWQLGSFDDHVYTRPISSDGRPRIHYGRLRP